MAKDFSVSRRVGEQVRKEQGPCHEPRLARSLRIERNLIQLYHFSATSASTKNHRIRKQKAGLETDVPAGPQPTSWIITKPEAPDSLRPAWALPDSFPRALHFRLEVASLTRLSAQIPMVPPGQWRPLPQALRWADSNR